MMLTEIIPDNAQSFWLKSVQSRIAHIQNVSSFDTTSLVTDARQALDDELAAMHLAMCALRTRRNALASISKLPSEVLARIFRHHADMEPPCSSQKPPLGWIYNTHVCRHWRITALQQPYLWGHIDPFITPEWQELFFDRAKAFPVSFLHLSLELPVSNLVAKHLFHISAIMLQTNTMALQQLLPTLTSSANLLESFTIISRGPRVAALTSFLPVNVLNGHSPRLRTLDLDGVLIPWSAPILKDLTHLFVRPTRNEVSNEIPTAISRHDHLIEAFQKMPALEYLSLDHCLPPRLPSSASNEIINLRYLEALYMLDMSDRCAGVLKHLRVPPYCRLSLDMKGPVDVDDVLPFLCAYAAGDGGRAPIVTLALAFEVEEVEKFTLAISRAYIEADGGNINIDGPGLNFHMKFQFIQSGQSLDLARHLCRVLPLENLRSLSILDSHPDWTSQNWVDIFGQCTALESVLLHGRSVVHYCGELFPPGHAPLSSLHTLSLWGLNFHDDIIHGSVFHGAFLAWLTARKETGPLFRLIIKNCWATRAYVTELRQFLEVEWERWSFCQGNESDTTVYGWDAILACMGPP